MRILGEALTFDDVLLVPAASQVLPREADLSTKISQNIALNIPLASAAMDTVTGARLAITLAGEGGIGIIHKNMSIEEQAREVSLVKRYESGVVNNPVTISPEATLEEVYHITEQTRFSALPVVDGEQLVGIITSRDMRFAKDHTQKVSALMTNKSNLVTVPEGVDRNEVISLLHQHRIEKVLVINDSFELKGMITVKDIMKAEEKPLACKDEQGRLRVGAAVGVGDDSEARVKALVDAGVDLIVVDTAHGHSEGVISRVQWIKKHYPQIEVVGGNIATAQAAKALIKAGANGLKVGIGPGSICTTRIVTGVGVPQLTAITNVVEEANKHNVPVIADGGIRFSGDIAKAIASGASVVMIGSLFAGTDESPGEVELYQGRSYKSYRGMGSMGAMSMTHGSSDRYFQETQNQSNKLVPEGIEGRVPYKGPMVNIVHQLIGGLRSAMGYTGSIDIETMRTKPEFYKVSSAGMQESHVHGVKITKQPPNYQPES